MRNIAMPKLWQRPDRFISAQLIVLAVLVVVFTQAAFAQTPFPVASSSCSAATLKGQYSWLGSGSMKVPDQNDPSKTITIPTASIAFLTLDGNGNFNLLIDVVFDGNMLRENFQVSDTYLVNADCTGVLGSGIGPTFDLLAVRDGSSFLLISKVPGETASSEAKRVK